jgi:hypothetical protein
MSKAAMAMTIHFRTRHAETRIDRPYARLVVILSFDSLQSSPRTSRDTLPPMADPFYWPST